MITLFSHPTSSKQSSKVLISEEKTLRYTLSGLVHDPATSHGHCTMGIELDVDFITENQFM